MKQYLHSRQVHQIESSVKCSVLLNLTKGRRYNSNGHWHDLYSLVWIMQVNLEMTSLRQCEMHQKLCSYHYSYPIISTQKGPSISLRKSNKIHNFTEYYLNAPPHHVCILVH